MNDRKTNRREFLATAGAAVLIPLVGCRSVAPAQTSENDKLSAIRRNAIMDPANEWWGAKDAPDDVSALSRIAAKDSPGERMLIWGTVYSAAGKPAPSTLIYLYHTDVHGIYGRSGEHRHGKYRGWLLTDEEGKYSFETIMPASYPDSTIAAHIHMTVTTATQREDWIDSILFEGDRFITPAERRSRRGGFDPILEMKKGPDGMLTGVRNIQLS